MNVRQLFETISASEKTKLVKIAAEMLKVQPSEVLAISDMWDALHWKNTDLDKRTVNGETFTLKGDSSIQVVHVLRTSTHPNFLFSTKKSLLAFTQTKLFKDGLDALDNDELAKMVKKYHRRGVSI